VIPYTHASNDSFWLRFIKVASAGAQKRKSICLGVRVCFTSLLIGFIDTTRSFLEAIEQEAHHRRAGVIPDLNSYIKHRRHTSSVFCCFVLAEYAHHLDLPEEIVEHPLLKNMADASNDFVCWSNVRENSSKECSRFDAHCFWRTGSIFLQRRTSARGYA
jgi:hypothetical protein